MASNNNDDDKFPTIIPPPASPNHSSFLVNFPGYINSEKRALATFGGINGLSKQLQLDSSSIQLKLRPEDPYSHPIIADRVHERDGSCVVVKLSRPKNHHSNNNTNTNYTSYTCTVVAAPSSVYSFTSPADMQFLPAIGHRFRRDTTTAAATTTTGGGEGADGGGGAAAPDGVKKEPFGIPPEPLLCLPAVFLEQPIYDYAFQDEPHNGTVGATVPASTTGEDKQGDGGVDTGTGTGSGYTISFLDASVPLPAVTTTTTQPPPSHLTSQIQLSLYTHLTQALQDRPIWLPAPLFDHLGEEAHSSPIVMKDLLTLLCYKFRNGPWRGAWIKKGYDPRMAAVAEDAVGYQVLRYQLPIEWVKFKAATAVHNNNNNSNSNKGGAGGGGSATDNSNSSVAGYDALVNFQVVPQTQNTTIQLRDLQDKTIKSVLHTETQRIAAAASNNSSNTVCTDVVMGWLTSGAWETIRKSVRERFQALMTLEQQEIGQQQQQQQQQQQGVFMDVDVSGMASIQNFLKEMEMNRVLLAGESSDDDDDDV